MRAVSRATLVRWLGYAASAAVVAWLLLVVLPEFGDLDEAGALLQERIGAGAVVLIIAVLALFVLTHAMTLKVAVPAVTLRRALLVRTVTGGIGRVVPAGWTVGTGTMAAMLRSSGVPAAETTHGIVVTATWNSLTKLSLPLLGMAAMFLAGAPATARGFGIAAGAVAAVLATVAAVWLLTRERVGVRVGRLLERPIAAGARKLGREPPGDLVARGVQLQASTAQALRKRPAAMAGWYYAHHLTQATMVWIGMQVAAGTEAPAVGWPEVLTAFAVGYLLTGLPISPGGLGTLDVTVLAVLSVLGGDPAVGAAGLIVYRLAIYALYAVALLAWLLWPRRASPGRGMAS